MSAHSSQSDFFRSREFRAELAALIHDCRLRRMNAGRIAAKVQELVVTRLEEKRAGDRP